MILVNAGSGSTQKGNHERLARGCPLTRPGPRIWRPGAAAAAASPPGNKTTVATGADLIWGRSSDPVFKEFVSFDGCDVRMLRCFALLLLCDALCSTLLKLHILVQLLTSNNNQCYLCFFLPTFLLFFCILYFFFFWGFLLVWRCFVFCFLVWAIIVDG